MSRTRDNAATSSPTVPSRTASPSISRGDVDALMTPRELPFVPTFALGKEFRSSDLEGLYRLRVYRDTYVVQMIFLVFLIVFRIARLISIGLRGIGPEAAVVYILGCILFVLCLIFIFLLVTARQAGLYNAAMTSVYSTLASQSGYTGTGRQLASPVAGDEVQSSRSDTGSQSLPQMQPLLPRLEAPQHDTSDPPAPGAVPLQQLDDVDQRQAADVSNPDDAAASTERIERRLQPMRSIAGRSFRRGSFVARHPRYAAFLFWWYMSKAAGYCWAFILVYSLASQFTNDWISCSQASSLESVACLAYQSAIFPSIPVTATILSAFMASFIIPILPLGLITILCLYILLAAEWATLYTTSNPASSAPVNTVVDIVQVVLGALVGLILSVAILYTLEESRRSALASLIAVHTQFQRVRATEAEIAKLRETEVMSSTARSVQDMTIGYASHQLRNPLHAAIILCSELEERPLSPTARADIEGIHAALDAMTRVTEDVISHKKLLGGEVRIARQRVPLHNLVNTVAQQFVDSTGRSVVIGIEDDVPSTVMTDPLRIAQALTNALANAARATPSGGRILIFLRIMAEPINVTEMFPKHIPSPRGTRGGASVAGTAVSGQVRGVAGPVPPRGTGLSTTRSDAPTPTHPLLGGSGGVGPPPPATRDALFLPPPGSPTSVVPPVSRPPLLIVEKSTAVYAPLLPGQVGPLPVRGSSSREEGGGPGPGRGVGFEVTPRRPGPPGRVAAPVPTDSSSPPTVFDVNLERTLCDIDWHRRLDVATMTGKRRRRAAQEARLARLRRGEADPLVATLVGVLPRLQPRRLAVYLRPPGVEPLSVSDASDSEVVEPLGPSATSPPGPSVDVFPVSYIGIGPAGEAATQPGEAPAIPSPEDGSVWQWWVQFEVINETGGRLPLLGRDTAELFNPFMLGGPFAHESTGRLAGTGLGLPICSLIAASLRGRTGLYDDATFPAAMFEEMQLWGGQPGTTPIRPRDDVSGGGEGTMRRRGLSTAGTSPGSQPAGPGLHQDPPRTAGSPLSSLTPTGLGTGTTRPSTPLTVPVAVAGSPTPPPLPAVTTTVTRFFLGIPLQLLVSISTEQVMEVVEWLDPIPLLGLDAVGAGEDARAGLYLDASTRPFPPLAAFVSSVGRRLIQSPMKSSTRGRRRGRPGGSTDIERQVTPPLPQAGTRGGGRRGPGGATVTGTYPASHVPAAVVSMSGMGERPGHLPVPHPEDVSLGRDEVVSQPGSSHPASVLPSESLVTPLPRGHVSSVGEETPRRTTPHSVGGVSETPPLVPPSTPLVQVAQPGHVTPPVASPTTVAHPPRGAASVGPLVPPVPTTPPELESSRMGLSISLPVPPRPPPAAPAPRRRGAATTAPSLFTALVVDDEETNRRLNGKLVKRLGGSFKTASDGDEVIAMLSETEGVPFDVILLNMLMKRVHGDAVTVWLREEKGFTGPIIACTANASETDQLRYLRQGVTKVLMKPFGARDLEAVLWEVGVLR